MSLSLTIRISGDATVRRKLALLGDRVNNMPEAMAQIGKEAANYYATVGFTDHGREYRQEWRELSTQYLKWKEKNFPGRPIMIRGDLSAKPASPGHRARKAVKSENMQGSFFAKSSATQVTIGNTASYYKYHQSEAERNKLPRRQMAGINGNIKDIVKNIIREDIKKKLDSV